VVGIVLDVDPSDFLESSGRASAATRVIASARESLRSGLADSSRMAGSDPTGAKWAGQYDAVVADAVRALDSLEYAFGKIAAGLAVTGLNYATADWLSSGQVGHAPGFAVPSLPVASCSAAPPSAAGGSRTPDIPGWELVASFVGDMWPGGDPTRLRHAHSQWSTLADRLDIVHHRDLPGILASLDNTRTPELPAIHSTLTTVSTAVSNLSQEARNLGAAARELADQIDEVHRQTAEVVTELVVELGATVLIGAGLTVVTAGLSDAAAAGVGAAKVATAVGRIVRFVGDLASATDRLIASVARSAVTVGRVARIPERITIRIVTITGRSVVTGSGGAATNVGITAITAPGADLDDAAVQGFVVGAGLGGLGATARLAGVRAGARDAASALRLASLKRDIRAWSATSTPGYREYGRLSEDDWFSLYLKRFDKRGFPLWRWPKRHGFVTGSASPNTLRVGEVISRISPRGVDGSFAARAGTPFSRLSLPPDRLSPAFETTKYEVLMPLPPEVMEGRIASHFEQPGDGFQYYFPDRIQVLVDAGFLKEVP
jgi:hypothetical protein